MSINDEPRMAWRESERRDLLNRCDRLALMVGAAIVRTEADLRATRVFLDDLISTLEEVLARRVPRPYNGTVGRFGLNGLRPAHESVGKDMEGVPVDEVDVQGARMTGQRRTAAVHHPAPSARQLHDAPCVPVIASVDRQAPSSGGKEALVKPKSQRKSAKPTCMEVDNGFEYGAPVGRPDARRIFRQAQPVHGVDMEPRAMDQFDRVINAQPSAARARRGKHVELMFARHLPAMDAQHLKTSKQKLRRRAGK